MCMIVRLICKKLSGIAVDREIRFLMDPRHDVYGVASFIAIAYVMIFTQGQEIIYLSYFVYEYLMYPLVTI